MLDYSKTYDNIRQGNAGTKGICEMKIINI